MISFGDQICTFTPQIIIIMTAVKMTFDFLEEKISYFRSTFYNIITKGQFTNSWANEITGRNIERIYGDSIKYKDS